MKREVCKEAGLRQKKELSCTVFCKAVHVGAAAAASTQPAAVLASGI